MNKRYKVGIIISILLLLFNQAFIQFWLSRKEDNAKEINVAGKQRMLSQKINLGFYHGEAKDGQLRSLFNEWERVNNAFLNGDEELGIQKTDNQEVALLLNQLRNNISYTKNQLERAEKGLEINEERLYNNQAEFLKNMDKAVKLLEFDSNQALFLIKITEVVLMLFSMLVLILEVVLIYRPINNKLQKSFDELKNKNAEVEKNNIDLKRLNDSLEEYAFITAHDLSEPVRKISIYTDELTESLEENDKIRTVENIKILNESSKRLKNYFQGVLSLNSIDIIKNYKKQKISTQVDDVIFLLEQNYPEVECVVNIETNDCNEILFDKDEFPTLIHEIIKNSFVYRIPNKTLEITVSTRLTEKNVELTFEYNGIGVDLTYEHKVYQIFQRLHGRNEYEGYGIGLALCKRIVETHGGSLFFDKKKTNGAKLVVQLPIERLPN